jgi:hypothetical protein
MSALVAFACGGAVEQPTRGSGADAGAAPGADAGDAPSADASAGDTGPPPASGRRCEPLADGTTLLASGFGYADHVAAPKVAGDPVLVRDAADSRFYAIDELTGESRSWLVSETLVSDRSRDLVVVGAYVAWIEDDTVWLRHLDANTSVPLSTRASPVALTADAQALYVLSARMPEYGSVTGTDVSEAYIDELARSALGAQPRFEPVATVDITGIARWNRASMYVSTSQIVLHFGYQQLDVDGPYTLLSVDRATLAPRILYAGHSTSTVEILGSDILVQRGSELVVYAAGATDSNAIRLRDDLDHWHLSGAIPPWAIVVDSWNERPLLALPLTGGAGFEIACDVMLWDAVATFEHSVYFTTSDGELWRKQLSH